VSSRRLAVLCTAAFLTIGCGVPAYGQSETENANATTLDIDVGVGLVYDDNVTRAPSGPDRISDQFVTANATKSFVFPVKDFNRITVDATLGGELADRHAGLSNAFVSLQGAWQYRPSTDFSAPTFAAFARGTAEYFGSSLRTGSRYSAGISARQPITDRVGLFGALAHNWRYADSSVFETHDNSGLVTVDYSAAPYGTFSLTAEYRRGNVVSTGQQTLAILDIAQVFIFDDVFTSPAMIDYRFEAKTVITNLVYSLPIGSRSAFELSWRRAQTTSIDRASFAGGGKLQYVDNQLTAFYVIRF